MTESTAAVKPPDERHPTTIDKDVICHALELNASEEDEASKDFLLKTANTLRLEFKQILKVENLQHLRALTRLFLDNNLIERISGLDQLFHLTWLDLSFNRIRKIEGLESLRKLEVLALFNNEISKLENLDHLSELKVLRVGCNRLASKQDILYLRRLSSLRTMSMRGNPICESIGTDDDDGISSASGTSSSAGDWEGFVMALVPSLSYLECRAITPAMREAAIAAHQGDVFRAKNAEEQAREATEKIKEEKASKQRHRAAFVASLRGPDLTKAVFQRHPEEEELLERLLSAHGVGPLKQEFIREMSTLGDSMYELGLRELDAREAEVAAFEGCVRRAQRVSQEKGIALVESFLEEKEAIFEAAGDLSSRLDDKEPEEVTAEQREEGEALRERFSTAVKDIWAAVMRQEVTLVNQTEAVLNRFESNLSVMMSNFMGEISKLFEKARSADTRYFRRLSALGEALEELPYKKRVFSNGETSEIEEETDLEEESEAARVTSLIALCHDGHQELLVEEERRLHAATAAWVSDFLRRFARRERRRGRNRVLELGHFVDICRGEEDELDVVPPSKADGDPSTAPSLQWPK